MCLIAFAWLSHPRWRLVLAGNRDEFHARASAPLARWDGLPLIAGRDLEGGGTWLGVNSSGRCGVVTNVRDPRDPQHGLSRGLLVTDWLLATSDAPMHARALHQLAVRYRPFNLLTFDDQAAFYLGNRPGPSAQPVAPGVHGLSNADFNTTWPKTRRLMARLQAWLEDATPDDFAVLFKALADELPASDEELPDTGIGRERERHLSAAFIRGETYGTRASTVVAIDHAGGGRIIERRFGPGGRPEGETSLQWAPSEHARAP
ncbi:MAG TPA: NRDE family protein [Frateuria sp.]|uniref:NRDE family protein n=1 Tax=Frateuria sp. TaxID=2211372 RepID=UPI002DECAA53|nr:NRDE family protein [Frateuria sp.]